MGMKFNKYILRQKPDQSWWATVLYKGKEDWYPALIEHAFIITLIGLCEEDKYSPKKNPKFKGYQFSLSFYAECLHRLVPKYINTGIENINKILPKIYDDIKKIYDGQFDPKKVRQKKELSYAEKLNRMKNM